MIGFGTQIAALLAAAAAATGGLLTTDSGGGAASEPRTALVVDAAQARDGCRRGRRRHGAARAGAGRRDRRVQGLSDPRQPAVIRVRDRGIRPMSGEPRARILQPCPASDLTTDTSQASA